MSPQPECPLVAPQIAPMKPESSHPPAIKIWLSIVSLLSLNGFVVQQGQRVPPPRPEWHSLVRTITLSATGKLAIYRQNLALLGISFSSWQRKSCAKTPLPGVLISSLPPAETNIARP